MKRVAIAGASGFVGDALVRALVRDPDHEVIALARSARPPAERVTWRACNLLNLREAEDALAGADSAVYLVHSMAPTARLMQGEFENFDLLAADNFARAAARAGIRHVVYLGGLLPRNSDERLSRHLASRLEVERTLASRGVPVTTVRAGLILGRGGSSFEMMRRLVERLPVMIGPRWTRSKTQPVALEDVVSVLVYALGHPEIAGRAYDVGCPEVVTYADLLRLTGEAVGRRVRILTVPMRTLRLSLLWVSLFGDTSPDLVRPLVESLEHDLVAEEGLTLQAMAGVVPTPLREALRRAVDAREERERAPRRSAPRPTQPIPPATACSVQRLPLPPGRDAAWVAAEYARWLGSSMRGALRVDGNEDGDLRFSAAAWHRSLLELSPWRERSAPDRALFKVARGALLGRSESAAPPRLEFREVLDRRFVLAAVQDYPPSLPWPVYTATQARVHSWVMCSFGEHLAQLAENAS